MTADWLNQVGLGDGLFNTMQAHNAQEVAYRNALAAQSVQHSAYLNAMRGMGQYKPYPEPKVTPHRTPEQIREQLEARLAEMEREAVKPEKMLPCSACRWVDGAWCKQPLVIGLECSPDLNWDRHHDTKAAKLCGPEKALWEPRRTILQRIADWMAK